MKGSWSRWVNPNRLPHCYRSRSKSEMSDHTQPWGLKKNHLGLFPLGVHTATIRARHQGLFHTTRRDLNEAVRFYSHTQPLLDPACAIISFRIVTLVATPHGVKNTKINKYLLGALALFLRPASLCLSATIIISHENKTGIFCFSLGYIGS